MHLRQFAIDMLQATHLLILLIEYMRYPARQVVQLRTVRLVALLRTNEHT